MLVQWYNTLCYICWLVYEGGASNLHGDMIFIQTYPRPGLVGSIFIQIFGGGILRKNLDFYLNRYKGFSQKISIFIQISIRDLGE